MKSRLFLLTFPVLLGSGCAALLPERDREPVPVEQLTAPGETYLDVEAVLPPVKYDGEALASVLAAEMAAQRGDLETSAYHYARAAREVESPRVRARAARIASYIQNHELTLEMTTLWLALQPSSEALELAALAEIGRGEAERASTLVERLLGDSPDASLVRLVRNARSMDPMGTEGLLETLGTLAERYPEQAPLWHARALHLQQQNRPVDALEAAEKALDLDPRNADLQLLRGQLLHEMDEVEEALAHVAELVEADPDSRRARILYVQLLLEEARDEEAYSQLRELAARYPGDQDLRYSLALSGLEFDALDTSRSLLEELLEQGYRPDEVRLQLGRAAELQDDLEAAQEYYLEVRAPEHRLEAGIQAARLAHERDDPRRGSEILTELREEFPERVPMLYAAEAELLMGQDLLEESIELLDEALAEVPDNRDLRYARALTLERLDRVDEALEELARILEEFPDDPHALNARGYILTDRTDRHEEALEYIERALELKPDNPAIQDSKGWALFHLGRPEEALEYLEGAWEAYPDGEVGAHVVEVLWELDRRDEAREFWDRAREQDPDSRHLEEVRERLLE